MKLSRWSGRLRIIFGSVELAHSCNDDQERLRVYGPELANALRRRLCQIEAAGHLAELRSVPAARLRADPTSPEGWLRVGLRQSADLRARPREEPPPRLSDGRLDEVRIHELLVSDVIVAGCSVLMMGTPQDTDQDPHRRKEATR
jgi:proteic killer suppression protein